MGNVLSEEKRQQVLALGRLGWPLRRIQQETGVRRETASKAAGIAVRPPGGWGKRPPASKPANETSPDFGEDFDVSATAAAPAATPASAQEPSPPGSKPANEVSTDSTASQSATASVCEPYRD